MGFWSGQIAIMGVAYYWSRSLCGDDSEPTTYVSTLLSNALLSMPSLPWWPEHQASPRYRRLRPCLLLNVLATFNIIIATTTSIRHCHAIGACDPACTGKMPTLAFAELCVALSQI
jgi:hypothetical protein